MALLMPPFRSLFIGAILFMAAKCALSATSFTGKVIHVGDGDTLIVLRPDRTKIVVRLSDIDAPEVGHGQSRPAQPFSRQSKQSLQQLAGGQDAVLSCYEKDRYARMVCQVDVNGVNVNAEQVRRGMAWANRSNPRYVRNRDVFGLEEVAQRSAIGLWSSAQQHIPPWEWRRACWEAGSCVGDDN